MTNRECYESFACEFRRLNAPPEGQYWRVFEYLRGIAEANPEALCDVEKVAGLLDEETRVRLEEDVCRRLDRVDLPPGDQALFGQFHVGMTIETPLRDLIPGLMAMPGSEWTSDAERLVVESIDYERKVVRFRSA